MSIKRHECEVEAEIAKELAKHNTRIVYALARDVKTSRLDAELCIVVEKIDRKKRVGPVNLLCAYCPFCGAKIEEEHG